MARLCVLYALPASIAEGRLRVPIRDNGSHSLSEQSVKPASEVIAEMNRLFRSMGSDVTARWLETERDDEPTGIVLISDSDSDAELGNATRSVARNDLVPLEWGAFRRYITAELDDSIVPGEPPLSEAVEALAEAQA